MNSEYLRLAYERSIIKAMIRNTQSEYLRGDGQVTAKSQILCEEAPHSLSVVPEDQITDFLVKLEVMQRDNELEMSKYSMVKVKNEKEAASQSTAGQSHGSQSSKERNHGRKNGR